MYLHSVLAVMTVALVADAKEDAGEDRCYELRVYTAAPGKFDALHSRFRDHTCKLFEKHGMTNVGYWIPADESDERLFYVLAYPDRKARAKSWAAFMKDPDWREVWAASEKDGKLVTKVQSTMLHAKDYSPKVDVSKDSPKRVFELRTYTTTPGNLERLDARFRDHTMSLFAKHGMQNIVYWHMDSGQKEAERTLIYLLAHKDQASRDASFAAFRNDADWMSAREASEREAGGSLTEPDGVQSMLLIPTDYSPMQ